MNRTILLLFTLVAASGVWIAHHWDDLRIALGVDQTPEARAIRLAKIDCAIERNRTNEAAIADHMVGLENPEQLGWSAEARGDRYMVSFRYVLDGETCGYYFEVDLDHEMVRNIADDPELAEKYGIPAAPR